MNAFFWLQNLAAWCLQISLLVLVGACLPFCLRIRTARARLACWQLLLAGCLLLPLLQPWKLPAIRPMGAVSLEAVAATGPLVPPSSSLPSTPAMILLLLGAGILGRAAWLALGLWRLARYRRQASLLSPVPEAVRSRQAQLGVRPRVYVSAEVSGPVTFGVRDAVILMPSPFLDLPHSAQDAIACHELLHVRRRDWALTVLEECVRAVFWFHPAVWWLLGQIQLTREQAVDQEVVQLTGARAQYLDALLSIAAAKAQLDLAPAPLFLRKRHLAQRVASILKEVSMSRRQIALALSSAFGALVLAAGLAVWAFPLQAPLPDEKYVAVDIGGASLLHRATVEYPREARLKKIQGQVVLEVSIDQAGLVSDARVLSGPEELRRAALQSVLQWHYSKEMSLPAKTQVALQFRLPGPEPVVTAELKTGQAQAAAVARAEGVVAGKIEGVIPRSPDQPRILKRVEIEGIPQSAREALLSRLSVHEGDPLTAEVMAGIKRAVMETDEHLMIGLAPIEGGTLLRIFLRDQGAFAGRMISPAPAVASASATGAPSRIRVGGNVQSQNLIEKRTPVYPPLAKQARIQGVVSLNAVIGKDGHILQLTVESGHPLLIPAALEAVKDWVYNPTLLNGNPVEVVTQIDVNFTLLE